MKQTVLAVAIAVFLSACGGDDPVTADIAQPVSGDAGDTASESGGPVVIGDLNGTSDNGTSNNGGTVDDTGSTTAGDDGAVAIGDDTDSATSDGGQTITPAPGLEPGFVIISNSDQTVTEGAAASIQVQRVGGADGAVAVNVATVAGTASADDFTPLNTTFSWRDGDAGVRVVEVITLTDRLTETDELFSVVLSDATGGAIIGDRFGTHIVTIVDSSDEANSTIDEADNADDTNTADTISPGGSPTIDGNNLIFGDDPIRLTLGVDGSEISGEVYPSDSSGSVPPSISRDGRFILFDTFAPGVVAGDNDTFLDVFLRDTTTGAITQVSLGVDGSQANGHSRALDISADGRFSLFRSFAQNLITGGVRGNAQLYLHDSQTADTTLISSGTDGRGGELSTLSGFMSADGELIVYESSPRFVGEQSTISLYRRSTGETRNIDLSQVLQTTELFGPDMHAMTPDGRFILLSCCVSEVNDFDVNVFTYDTTDNVVELLPGAGLRNRDATISDDGQIIVYGNGRLLDRSNGNVKELNLDAFRTLSPDGRWLPYTQIDAENSVFFLRDNLNDVDYVTNRRIGGFTGDGNNAHLTTARSDLGVTDTNSVFDVYLYDFPLSDLP